MSSLRDPEYIFPDGTYTQISPIINGKIYVKVPTICYPFIKEMKSLGAKFDCLYDYWEALPSNKKHIESLLDSYFHKSRIITPSQRRMINTLIDRYGDVNTTIRKDDNGIFIAVDFDLHGDEKEFTSSLSEIHIKVDKIVGKRFYVSYDVKSKVKELL